MCMVLTLPPGEKSNENETSFVADVVFLERLYNMACFMFARRNLTSWMEAMHIGRKERYIYP